MIPNTNEPTDVLDSNNTEPPAAKKAKVVVNKIDTDFIHEIKSWY